MASMEDMFHNKQRAPMSQKVVEFVDDVDAQVTGLADKMHEDSTWGTQERQLYFQRKDLDLAEFKAAKRRRLEGGGAAAGAAAAALGAASHASASSKAYEKVEAVAARATGDHAYLVDNSLLKHKGDGIRYRLSRNDQDKDKPPAAKWGTVVLGVEVDGDWLMVGERYLPMTIKGKRVLTREPDKPFRVDNSLLQHKGDGLRYRLSRNTDDKAPPPAVPWGSVVKGVDLGDGWLKVGSKYLPMEVKAVRVLTAFADGGSASGRPRDAKLSLGYVSEEESSGEESSEAAAADAAAAPAEAEAGDAAAEHEEEASAPPSPASSDGDYRGALSGAHLFSSIPGG